MIVPRLAVLAAAALLATAAVSARAQGAKVKPWTPPAPGQASTTPQSAPAPAAAYDTLRTAPLEGPLPTPPGVTRSFDLLYQPSVPDSLWPFVPRYREVATDEVLTTYVGALRQGLPVRPYPVILDKETVHATVDGLEGQSHLAIMLMVPWIGSIMAQVETRATLAVKMDDGPEQKWKLQLTPGPILYVEPASRPVPVSNPTLLMLPLPPGKHRVKLQLKDLDAPYAYLLLGQPILSPPALARSR